MTRSWPRALLAVPLLVPGCAAGCAASQASTAASDPTTTSASAAPGAGPPAAARMVCDEEIRTTLVQVLRLEAPAATEDSWVDGTYTCTHSLPMGPLVLSVHVLSDPAAAGAALDAQRAEVAGASPLVGLGERAFGTPAGEVVVLEDEMTLTVDPTGMPEVFGANGQRRSDLAYEVATDVLGCWTEHG